jgi:hypothetical protein
VADLDETFEAGGIVQGADDRNPDLAHSGAGDGGPREARRPCAQRSSARGARWPRPSARGRAVRWLAHAERSSV